MVASRLDIPEDVRSKAAKRLNGILASGIDLQLQTKQAHWNVKGENFIALHKMFDELRADVDEYVDLIAERIVQLGGIASGTLQHVSGATKLPAYPAKAENWPDHVEAITRSLSSFGGDVRAGIDDTDEMGDKGTADVLTEVSRGADKWVWFVGAHLQGPK